MKTDAWDINTPVELSSYLQDKELIFYNTDVSFKSAKPYMLDLFCGAGGFSVGASWAGFEPVFGIDHFKPAMDTWITNHPSAIGCLGDIRKLDPKDVHTMLKEKGVQKITLLTGGVPCQGFTIANRKHNDNDERNFLYLEYMKYVKEFMPDYIILENVSGMRSTAGGHFESEIKSSMEMLGYSTTVQMISAAAFGVPQYRQRLVFVGVKRNTKYPKPYVFPKELFTQDQYRTAGDAFSDLPLLNAGETKTEYATPPQNDYQKLLRGVGEIQIPAPGHLYNHSAPNHPQSTIELINSTTPGQPMYPTFKQRIRLEWNTPSPTQLAGGIRPSFQFGHPVDPRGLSTRERARIQSFPDSYVFKGGIVQERVQTGNAVPPLMIYYVIKEIANAIHKSPTNFV